MTHQFIRLNWSNLPIWTPKQIDPYKENAKKDLKKPYSQISVTRPGNNLTLFPNPSTNPSTNKKLYTKSNKHT